MTRARCYGGCSMSAQSQLAIPRAPTWSRSMRAARKFDGGIVTRITAIPHGIVVDRQAKRFHDEGEDARKITVSGKSIK